MKSLRAEKEGGKEGGHETGSSRLGCSIGGAGLCPSREIDQLLDKALAFRGTRGDRDTTQTML